MFPLRDGIPSRRFPAVTLSLITVNVLVFLYQWTLPDDGLKNLFYLFGIVPARLSDPVWAVSVGYTSGGWLSFLSSMFLHGGFLHLAFNMWTLWIFGDNVEDRLGRGRFLLFYLACGLAAGGLQWLTDPASTVPTIGASGAIAGVLGAYLWLYPHARILTLIPILIYPLFVHIPALVYLGIWFLLQLTSGIQAFGQDAAGQAGGVAWWAHVGGFVAGLLLLKLLAAPEPEQLPGPARHFSYPIAPVAPPPARRG